MKDAATNRRTLSFSGNAPCACFNECLRLGLRGAGDPTEIEVNENRVASMAEALELLKRWNRERIGFYWEYRTEKMLTNYDYLLIDEDGLVKVGQDPCPIDAQEVRTLLRQLPFELASGGKIISQWWRDHDYVGPHFTSHYPFGWMCAFKGEGGHRWLVSRRFLDYGPWRLIRDEASDLSMVQFHDLEADEETAFAQARLGHRYLMDDDAGGVIAEGETWLKQEGGELKVEKLPFQYTVFHPNFYDRASKTSIVLVQDREVSLLEMMEACAARLWQPYEGITVEQVAFVFFDPAQARRQLFDLWVRGLEVRAIEADGERRLDDSFEPPPPQVPEWVQRVREREGF